MSLPPKLHALARQRFDELIKEALQVVQDMKRDNQIGHARNAERGVAYLGEIQHQDTAFASLTLNTINLIELVIGNNQKAKEIVTDIRGLSCKSASAERVLGILRGLKSDFEAGMLTPLHEFLEANIAGDYMGQAERLLGEGIRGQFDHVPAAVLAGAVLEDALRRLCHRQSPPIATDKPNGDPKKMTVMIDDLKTSGIFNELKAKQLRSWADIRNAAAHGLFSEFNRQDVEAMLAGVETFLADYL